MSNQTIAVPATSPTRVTDRLNRLARTDVDLALNMGELLDAARTGKPLELALPAEVAEDLPRVPVGSAVLTPLGALRWAVSGLAEHEVTIDTAVGLERNAEPAVDAVFYGLV